MNHGSGGETMPDLVSKLKELLDYEPDSGLFRWLVQRNSYGGKISPGSVAGTRKDGYIQIIADQRQYRAHRLAWLFMTGSFPPKGSDIDHVDGERSNNRWSNLRLASRSQNNMNTKHVRPHSCSQRGVSWREDRGTWHARIYVNKKAVILGDFDLIEDAIAARLRAEQKYYGDFIRK